MFFLCLSLRLHGADCAVFSLPFVSLTKRIATAALPMKLPFGETKGSLQHKLSLQSAYTQCNGHEPEITNSLGGDRQFEGCLDYIWLSSDSLRAVEVLPLPSIDEARAEGGALPNSRIPSDHLPIGAHIVFLNEEAALTPTASALQVRIPQPILTPLADAAPPPPQQQRQQAPPPPFLAGAALAGAGAGARARAAAAAAAAVCDSCDCGGGCGR